MSAQTRQLPLVVVRALPTPHRRQRSQRRARKPRSDGGDTGVVGVRQDGRHTTPDRYSELVQPARGTDGVASPVIPACRAEGPAVQTLQIRTIGT